MQVALIMGSKSDTKSMAPAAELLKDFGVKARSFILSAHRVPEKLEEVLRELEKEDTVCIIAGAGLAAHLPGVIASKTLIPVVGVPLDVKLGGMDALLSIVQMPKGIPVATVGIGNSVNGALTALQFAAAADPSVKEKLSEYRKNMKEKFLSENGGEITL